MSAESVILEAATSADGTRRWKLKRRHDGFVVYFEDTFISEDLTEFGAGIQEYWSPTHFSGLFVTVEEAKADALGTLPWLNSLGSVA